MNYFIPLIFYCLFFCTNPNVSVYHFIINVLNKGSFLINDKGFIITGESLNYLTIFFNSNFFRFCYKEYFPELLGESRELRKVFFENINIMPVKDESWYKEILEQILTKKKEGLSIDRLQNQVEENLFDLYRLSSDERNLIRSALHSTVY